MTTEYTTDYLLDRVYEKLQENKVSTKETDYTPPDAKVMKYGSKKTGVTNFKALCEELNRTEQELMKYFFNEFSCQGSITGNHELILNGNFKPPAVQGVLNKYIKKYVLCYSCKNSRTQLIKENRLVFLTCDNCKSRTSVD